MKTIFKHNFIPSKFNIYEIKYNVGNLGILSVAAGVMATHYEAIVKVFDACPIPVLVGESETGKCAINKVKVLIFVWTGKSLAARCALSLSGQIDLSYPRKTKSTSDSICMERCCKSTLPFILHHPKSLEAVSDLLINLCNGQLMVI